MDHSYRQTLAWHETLEMHELVVFQSIGLMKLKMGLKTIQDNELVRIYSQTINGLEQNLLELLPFYPAAPHPGHSSEYRVTDSFSAGDLLVFAKTAVRNYAVAITETATPALRMVLQKQLIKAIKTHEQIYSYMYKKGLYPSYDLNKLLHGDIRLVQQSLSM